MGFLNNIFSSFEKNTYRGICRAMIKSYNGVKKQNPDASSRELCALALSLRPTWKREKPSSFVFIRVSRNLIIEKNDKLKEVVRKIIIAETLPLGASRDPNFLMNTSRAISEVIDEGFKEFKE